LRAIIINKELRRSYKLSKSKNASEGGSYMERIVPDLLLKSLKKLIGQKVYIHFEVNPGGYFRNGNATLYDAHVKGEGNFRVYLELEKKESIIHVDQLTHMSITKEQIILMGYDEYDRLARTLEISNKPFSM
jgi:hypothetical protein